MTRFLLPMIFIVSNSYAAGIQKWTDENGNIHYGDAPPARVKTESIKVSRPPSNPGKPLPRLNTEKDKQKDNKNQAEESKKTRAIDKKEASKICEQSRHDQEVITSNNVIRMKMADGNERVLTDEEVDKRLAKIKLDIKKYCK